LKNFIINIFLFSIILNFSSCFLDKNTVNISGVKGKKFYKKPNATISNVSIINNQLKIQGDNFYNIKTIKIKGSSGFNELFNIETKNDNIIVANSNKNISFLLNTAFELILSNAYGASSYQVNFTLQNDAVTTNKILDGSVTSSKLNSMGATAGKYLKWDGTSWVPSSIVPLAYQGLWKADGTGINLSAGGSPGDYYIVNVGGITDPNTNAGGGVTWNIGDWVMWNDTLAKWDRVPSVMAPASGDLSGNYPNLTVNNNAITDIKINDVNVSKITSAATKYFTYKPNNLACAAGEVLEFDATPGVGWICGTKTSTSNVTATGATNSAALNLASGTGDINLKTNSTSTKLTIKNNGTIEAGSTLATSAGSNLSLSNSAAPTLIELGETSSAKGSMKWDNINNYLSLGTQNAGSFNDTLVLKDGKVGIGTSSPQASLELNGAYGSQLRISRDIAPTTQYSDISAGGSSLSFTSESTAPSQFLFISSVSGTPTERMRIATSGNIGIGTTNPVRDLHIARASSTNSLIKFSNATVGNTVNDGVDIGMVSDGTALFQNKENLPMSFATNATNRMTITGGGNIGIGTTAPASKLEVSTGALGTLLNNTIEQQRLFSSNSNLSYLDFKQIRTSPGTDWTSAASRIQQKIDNTWMGYLQFNGTGNTAGISFGVGSTTTAPGNVTEAMRINSVGNVGIGMTNPSEKLNVNGNIYAQGVGNGFYGTFFNSGSPSYDATIAGKNIIMQPVSGNVGIGTTSPTETLTIKTDGRLKFNPNSTWGASLVIGGNGHIGNDASVVTTNGNLHLDGSLGASGTYINWYNGTGGLAVGNGTGGGYGPVMASSFNVSSDRRLKKDIKKIKKSIEKIKELNGVTFYYKDKNFTQRHQVGVIAQDVKKVFPELVNTNKRTGFYSVNYSGLVAPLIEATKEQQVEIENNKKLFLTMHEGILVKVNNNSRKIASLEEENEILRNEVDNLKSRLEKIERLLKK